MEYHNNNVAYSQPHAGPAGPPTGPPAPPYTPPPMPPAGPSWAIPSAPGQMLSITISLHDFAPSAWVHPGSVVHPLPPGDASGHHVGSTSSPAAPLAVKTPFTPPRTSKVVSPNEFDRDDEWDADKDASADSKAALDPLCATITRWATCASEWTAKDPSRAKTFQWEGLAQFARLFLRQFLRHEWLRTDAVMAHARLYFPDFSTPEVIYWGMRIVPEACRKPQKDFLCWLLADFGSVDPFLGDLVIAAGIEQAREMGCLRYFERLLIRELKMEPAYLKRLKGNAARMVSNGGLTSFSARLQLSNTR